MKLNIYSTENAEYVTIKQVKNAKATKEGSENDWSLNFFQTEGGYV